MTTPPSYVSGNVITGGFTYSAGESVTVLSGGQIYDMTMNSGGYEYVEKGGRATATTVNYSGNVYISAGTAYTTTVNSGGFQNVAGGAASGTIVNSGGVQSVYKGSATATTVHAGGTQDVGSGGREYKTTLAGGDHIYSGGRSYNEQVQSGGFEFLTRGGVSSNSVISAGGSAILANNVLYHDDFYARSGSEVASGTYKNGTETINFTGANFPYTKIVNSGNTREYYNSAGSLFLKTVRHGNELYETTYTSSGTHTFSRTSPAYKSGGIASGLVVESGGSVILDGGKTKNLTIHSGGTEVVGGTISVTSAGGEFIFYISGITVSNSHVGNGVTEIVKATDATAAAVISAGGTETILSGGTATNTTIDGGTLSLAVGAKVAGHIAFAGTGGKLEIDSPTLPTAAISGFAAGDSIVLAGIPYVSGATASVTTSGVVTITDGGKSYHLNIAGAAVGEDFAFSSGSILTLGSPAMSFVRPAPPPPPAADWRLGVEPARVFVSAASRPVHHSATQAYGVWREDASPAAGTPGLDLSRHFPPH